MSAIGPASRCFKLVLEYDGSDFAGWQVQPDARTVQGELERTLKTLTGESIRVTGAGRTDAGVHATGQVASFFSDCRFDPSGLTRALNATLPRDIRVRESSNPDNPFDARRDARERTYRYVLARRPRAVGRQYAYHPHGRLDLDSMIGASECLIGMHRWDAFCKKDENEDRYESEVLRIRWENDAETIAFEITAVRFFHHMVRILVGTLLEVARGKRNAEQIREILEKRDRSLAGPTAPPCGLFLMKVDY
jgi:tRNA pseudouridine38-40 synthase